MTSVNKEAIELKPCPFCGEQPSIRQDKVYHCQLHGEPSQAMIVSCKGYSCPSKPSVRAGDCYNHALSETFQQGKRKATDEAIIKWNTRAYLSATQPENVPPVNTAKDLCSNSEENVQRLIKRCDEYLKDAQEVWVLPTQLIRDLKKALQQRGGV